jgi:hypothetical protein
MALCALPSLLLFLGFLILVTTGGGLAFAGLAAALACPVIWLTVLLSNDRGRHPTQGVVQSDPAMSWRKYRGNPCAITPISQG